MYLGLYLAIGLFITTLLTKVAGMPRDIFLPMIILWPIGLIAIGARKFDEAIAKRRKKCMIKLKVILSHNEKEFVKLVKHDK